MSACGGARVACFETVDQTSKDIIVRLPEVLKQSRRVESVLVAHRGGRCPTSFRFKVEFTASSLRRHKLERLEALIPGSDLASIIDAAVREKLERLEAKRFG